MIKNKVYIRIIRSVSFVLFACLLSNLAVANEATVKLEKATIDIKDYGSLQRGAKYFLNFCASCHSAEYIRYSRIAKDINLTDSDAADGVPLVDLIKTNLMFNTTDINSHVKSSMTKKDAEKMFGVAPPDLTMITRVRGVDWVYTYLKSFYVDKNRPWGVNNALFKDVAMPHVLYNYQGKQELKDGHLQIVEPGKFNNTQYDEMVTDITNFLAYTAEPYKSERTYLGVWVLLFLSVFFVFAFLLKREYWRDIKKK